MLVRESPTSMEEDERTPHGRVCVWVFLLLTAGEWVSGCVNIPVSFWNWVMC